MTTDTQRERRHVLVAGGGVAGRQLVSALRVRARSRVRVTLVAPRAQQQQGAELRFPER
jgi:NADH dehydrogenase FAD-containing subunit